MKKIIFAALSFLVLGTTQASAGQYDCCDTACNPCCDWEFTAYADYLYWEVCEGDLSFQDANNTVHYLNPGYSSGYRLGLNMSCGESWDAGFRYTHLDSSTKEPVNVPLLFLTGDLKHSINYNVVDLELGYNLHFDCDSFHLRPFVGTKLAWIDNSFDERLLDSTNPTAPVTIGLGYSNCFSGYGIYSGFEGRYDFCNMDVCCSNLDIAFVARASVGILRGSVDGKAVDGANLVNFFTVDNCLYVTTVEGFVGVDFGYEYSECFAPHFLLGYEANTFIGMHEIGSINSRTNLGLGGLVARISVGF